MIVNKSQKVLCMSSVIDLKHFSSLDCLHLGVGCYRAVTFKLSFVLSEPASRSTKSQTLFEETTSLDCHEIILHVFLLGLPK